MSFRDVLKDSLVAALRNPGDTGGTLRDFKSRQNRRKGEASRDRLAVIMGGHARRAYEITKAKEQQGSWELQDLSDDFYVKVRSGFGRNQQKLTTEVEIYFRRDNPNKEHYHVVFDSDGNEVFGGYRPDHQA